MGGGRPCTGFKSEETPLTAMVGGYFFLLPIEIISEESAINILKNKNNS